MAASENLECSPADPLAGPPARPPLRVCLVVDSLRPDAGTERLVAGLAAALDPRVIEAYVCCFEAGERLSALPARVHTAVFPLASVNSLNGLRRVWEFRSYLKRNRIDAVHSFMNNSAVFSVLGSLGAGCRAVITSRLNCGYWYTKKWIWTLRILNRYSSHILANSALAGSVTASVEHVPPEKITVYYPGVDLRRYSASAGDPSRAAALGIPPHVPVVGIVANFRPVKDLALFLRAAAIVSRAVPDAAFLLVGQGPLKPDLQQLAAQLGIAGRVFFSSPGAPVPDYLCRMSVACLTSESESLPNAILEYMAAGLPVVAADVGGVSELVRDGVTGYLVRARTGEALAEPVIRLLRDDALRASMGRQGLGRAVEEFDSVAAVERLQRFYLDAVAAAHGRPTTTRP